MDVSFRSTDESTRTLICGPPRRSLVPGSPPCRDPGSSRYRHSRGVGGPPWTFGRGTTGRSTMHRTLIVARLDPERQPDVAQIFADSDATELPHMIGVNRRTLFGF